MSRPTDPYEWESWAWNVVASGRLTGREGLTLIALAKRGNGKGEARPSARTLGQMIGRSDKPAREALEAIYREGYIDGKPEPRRATVWRFVTDESEQARLRDLRTPSPADEPPPRIPICGPTADQLRTPGSDEGEGEDNPSLSSFVAKGRGRGSEDRQAGNGYVFRTRPMAVAA